MDASMEFDIESVPNIASELEMDADGVDLRALNAPQTSGCN